MERGLLFAFQVDYSHLRDKLITSKLSLDDYSHYTRECNELRSSEIETNIELKEEQIKETSNNNNIEKSCEGYSKYLPGYR